MSYLTQNEIAGNATMQNRVAQCAESETLPNGLTSDQWTSINRREWAAAPGWDNAWESAKVGHEDDEFYDPGTNEAAITDSMILAQVQSMLVEETA